MHATPAWLMTAAIRNRPEVAGGIEIEPVKSDNGKITLWRTTHTPCGEGPDGKLYFTSHDAVPTSKGDARDTGLFCKLNYTRTGFEVLEEQLRYAYWHAAPVYLVRALQFLASVEVLPTKAPIPSWLEDAEEERAPLPNLRPRRHIEINRRVAGRRATPMRASLVRKIEPRDCRKRRDLGPPAARGHVMEPSGRCWPCLQLRPAGPLAGASTAGPAL